MSGGMLVLLLALVAVLSPAIAEASLPSHLYRVDIRPRQGYTRLSFKLDSPAAYSLRQLPDSRIRLTVRDTSGPLLRKLRAYSDTSIGGVVFSRRGRDLLATFRVAQGAGWRDVTMDGVNTLTIDVGRRFSAHPVPMQVVSGREPIRTGIEKLVRDFDPPVKTEIPFQPTDRQVLKNQLDEADSQLFIASEAALYKGRLSEAEEGFTVFANRQGAIRPLALYRLGETWYKLQKYPQALAAFREAESLWPAYLNFSPSTTFYYGDSIARGGDLVAGRVLLAGLVARLSDKSFAPTLLVRLADIQARQGKGEEARALYLTIAEQFRGGKAGLMARMRLADDEFFRATPWNYRELGDTYLRISREGSDIELREEALFKQLLLMSLFGGTAEALQQVGQFQKRFPRGAYAAVCRTMREVLVARMYQETVWNKDPAALVRFVEEQQEYLSGCIVVPDFLRTVGRAYDEAGRPLELIKLFNSLLGHTWSASNAPYLYEEIAENSELLGDSAMARTSLQTFLKKFPSHPRTKQVMERLGGILFNEGKYQEARSNLVWLLNKGERAGRPESYYYLGRSLWVLKDSPRAAKAMDLFFATAGGGEATARLLPDAFLVAALARDASGDHTGAVRMLDAGVKLPGNARQQELLYRAGEISLRDGRKQAARSYFERVVKGGTDGDWQRLARQALESLAPPPR